MPVVSSVDDVVRAVDAGELVVIPTDTVYGLACRPDREEVVGSLSALKRRSPEQPIALVASRADDLLELVPELPARLLLAGPFTLVVPNPAGRLPWLVGARPGTIGVRIPVVVGLVAELLARIGVVAATSANVSGGPDPRRVEEIPEEIRAACGAIVDAGELPGVPSTVIDFTGAEPRVLRQGAGPPPE